LILVTGITGLTGRFLWQLFLNDNRIHELRCLVRGESNLGWMGEHRPALCFGDVGSHQDLVRAMQGVDSVIHLVNIRYSPQIITACQQVGVKRVVFVNTTGIFSQHQEYSCLYKQLERGIEASTLDYTIVRPTMIYGNGQDKNIHKLIKLLKVLRIFPIIGDGKSLMQPIYAGDLAKVIKLGLDKPTAIRQAYNVAGKEALSYRELLENISDAMGRTTRFIHVPFFLALILGRIGDYLPLGFIKTEPIRRLREDKAFDYSKAKNELGFNPLSFEEGVKLEVAALNEAVGYG